MLLPSNQNQRRATIIVAIATIHELDNAATVFVSILGGVRLKKINNIASRLVG